MNVAFLGLGVMGVPMATRLCQSFSTSVWNRTPKTIPSATVSKTPRECVQNADVVVTMLADAHALEDVLAGENGALAGLKKGAVLVEMSTSGRRAAISIAERVKKMGASFIDAPVSGTVGPAERGELLAFLGGSKEDIAKAQPVLDRMCNRFLHIGGIGQGQAMKVALNGLGAHHLIAFTSMLALAERAGRERFDGRLARDWTPQFSLDLTRKDLELNLELQDDVGLVLPVTRAIEKTIAEGIDRGLGEKDLFALEEIFHAK